MITLLWVGLAGFLALTVLVVLALWVLGNRPRHRIRSDVGLDVLPFPPPRYAEPTLSGDALFRAHDDPHDDPQPGED